MNLIDEDKKFCIINFLEFLGPEIQDLLKIYLNP